MTPFLRVLVGVSLAERGEPLPQYAGMLAGLDPAIEFRLQHVAPPGTAPGTIAEVSQRLAAFAEAVPGSLAGRVSSEVSLGPREDRLLEAAAAWRADLILVGHRRSRRGLRSLARRLAMKAPCSVWLVPEQAGPRLERILVPVDFSPRSADALKVAASLAGAAGIEELLALHVYFDTATVSYEGHDEESRFDLEDRFWRFCAPIDLRETDVSPLFVESARVAATICRVAEEKGCSLIVMDTRGRSRSAAVLLGSVTEEVLRHSSIPVLAVKHFGARMGLLKMLLDPRFRERERPRFG